MSTERDVADENLTALRALAWVLADPPPEVLAFDAAVDRWLAARNAVWRTTATNKDVANALAKAHRACHRALKRALPAVVAIRPYVNWTPGSRWSRVLPAVRTALRGVLGGPRCSTSTGDER